MTQTFLKATAATLAVVCAIVFAEAAQSGPKKTDVRGFYPGMPYQEVLRLLYSFSNIEPSNRRLDGTVLKCPIFLLPLKDAERDAREARDISCTTQVGFWSFTFTKHTNPKLLSRVSLDFASGAEPLEIVKNVSDQYGGQPYDASAYPECSAQQDNGLGFPIPRYRKANGDYRKCLAQQEASKNQKAVWAFPTGFTITLTRRNHTYYSYNDENIIEFQSPGFEILLTDAAIDQLDAKAFQDAIRRLNPRPGIVTLPTKNDIVGIYPGMYFMDALNALNQHGNCTDPWAHSSRPGFEFTCVTTDGEFSIVSTRYTSPKILMSVQLIFRSGAGEEDLFRIISNQFGVYPSEERFRAALNNGRAEWTVRDGLRMSIMQTAPCFGCTPTPNSWTIRLSDSAIEELDARAREQSQKSLNLNPKF